MLLAHVERCSLSIGMKGRICFMPRKPVLTKSFITISQSLRVPQNIDWADSAFWPPIIFYFTQTLLSGFWSTISGLFWGTSLHPRHLLDWYYHAADGKNLENNRLETNGSTLYQTDLCCVGTDVITNYAIDPRLEVKFVHMMMAIQHWMQATLTWTKLL